MSTSINRKTKKKQPSISVIIMTRETPYMILKRCYNRVRSQTLENIEIILLDANEKGNSFQQAISTDGGFLKDITYVYYPEKGEMVHGKNLALEKATADYITFIAAEDMMGETRLETILREIKNNTAHSVYYTGMTFQQSNALEFTDYTLASAKYRYLSQAVFHRSAFQLVGTFDEEMVSMCDEEFWMRICFFDLAGYVSDPDAAISIYAESYDNHTPLNAAIAYRQMLVKFPKQFRQHKSLKRTVYRNIAQNYREAHAISRYIQFRWKEICCK